MGNPERLVVFFDKLSVNNHFYRFLVLVLIECFATVGLCQPKNILFLKFAQKHFKTGETDTYTTYSVTYRLQCPKPSKFYGYDAAMVFEKSKISVVGGDRPVLYDATASAGADIKVGEYDETSGTLHAVVLGSQMFDTSNHVLFEFSASVPSLKPGDSALVIVTKFDALKDKSGIDTVIIENAPGRDDVSWYPFAIAYRDTAKVVVPKKSDIVFSSTGLALGSDSLGNIAFRLSGADSAKIKTGVFSCLVDTSVLEVHDASASASISLLNTSNKDTLRIAFGASSGYLISGELFTVAVRARHRTDTSCTFFSKPSLVISNTDNLVAAITYDLDSICVAGQLEDTTHNGVAEQESSKFSILTNGKILKVLTDDRAGELRIFSVTGALVYSASLIAGANVITPGLGSGVYMAVILSDRIVYRKPIVLVH